MNKKLIAITLLFITNTITMQSAALPAGAVPAGATSVVVMPPIAPASTTTPIIRTLDQMQQGYASKVTNDLKSQFISQILGQDNITLQEKIINLENLRKIINADISLHSGWLWNEPSDQNQIDWLYEKRSIIDRELKNVKWKASSFGYQVTVQAATMTSYYLMAVLLAYIGQYQYSQITGDQTAYSFGDLAAMPITKIIELASKASIGTINALTSPTAQGMLGKIYAGALAAGAVGYDYLADAIDAIGTAVPTAAQKGIGDIAQLIASKMKTAESKDQATQTKNPTIQSDSWVPPIITNTMKKANDYLEEKDMIHTLQENLSKNKKIIEQQTEIAKSKAVAKAIQNNESRHTYFNPILKAELETIEFQGKQQQAQLDLQTQQVIANIEKGKYKKS